MQKSKVIPAMPSWGDAPEWANYLLVLSNGGYAWSKDNISKITFPENESLKFINDIEVVTCISRKSVVTNIFLKVGGTVQQFNIEGQFDVKQAGTLLRSEKIDTKGAKIFVTYSEVPNIK